MGSILRKSSICLLSGMLFFSGCQHNAPQGDALQPKEETTSTQTTDQADKMPRYLQNDARWKDVTFEKSTLGASGDRQMALAMVASYFQGKEVHPDALQIKSEVGSYDPQYMSDFAAAYGLTCNDAKDTLAMVLAATSMGDPTVAISKENSKFQGRAIVVLGMQGNALQVFDPGAETLEKSIDTLSQQAFQEACSQFWVFAKPSQPQS